MKTGYVIVNSAGRKLSGFYPNAGNRSRFIVFREHDWFYYRTKKDAERHLAYIRRHGVGRNLRIVESAGVR